MVKGSALVFPLGVWLVPFFVLTVLYTIGSIIPTWMVISHLVSTQEKRMSTRSAKGTSSNTPLSRWLSDSSFLGSLSYSELLQLFVCLSCSMYEMIWMISLIFHMASLWGISAWLIFISVAFRHSAVLLTLLILIERLNVFDASVFRIEQRTKKICYLITMIYAICLGIWYVLYGLVIDITVRKGRLVKSHRRQIVVASLGICMAFLTIGLGLIGRLFAHTLARMVASTMPGANTHDHNNSVHSRTVEYNSDNNQNPPKLDKNDDSSHAGRSHSSSVKAVIHDLPNHQRRFIKVAAKVVNLNVIVIVSLMISQLGLILQIILSGGDSSMEFAGMILLHQPAVVIPVCVYFSFSFARDLYDRWCLFTDRCWVSRVMNITNTLQYSVDVHTADE